MFTLFSFLLSCSGKEQSTRSEYTYPEEKFSIIEANLENGIQLVGSINMSYKNFQNKNNYMWCLKVGIALDTNNLYENGLPYSEES